MKELVIGDLVAKVPIIQGGMGVGVSLGGLAGAVAKEGGIGFISAAQPGFREDDFYTNTFEANMRALNREIKKAKEISNGGIVGVNIMVAVTHYSDFVKCCIDSGADIIISGAGLPMDLPKFAEGSDIKLAPIVSSAKACKLILGRWIKKFNKVADLVVIEGPKAGGHLGFKVDEISEKQDNYDNDIKEIIACVKDFEESTGKKIPVVFAGGVFDRKDIDHCFELGLDGVQMATRFVATEECDSNINFKNAYIKCKKEDIKIVKSPVGLPGRAIYNKFLEKLESNKPKIKKCYNCMETCNPSSTPYCISQALINAVNGDIDNALLFCGAEAYKINKIKTVKKVIDELISEI